MEPNEVDLYRPWLTVQFVSGLVGNSKDRFCHDLIAHLRVKKAFELRHEKTNVLHMRKQRRRSASRYP